MHSWFPLYKALFSDGRNEDYSWLSWLMGVCHSDLTVSWLPYKMMTATVWLPIMRLEPHYVVDDIDWGRFLKWVWDDMQGLYCSLTHNFGCAAKTKALTKSPSSWLPPETGCTQQHRPWNRPTDSSSHMHTYLPDSSVLFFFFPNIQGDTAHFFLVYWT